MDSDPRRVLREFALEPLRRELRGPGMRVLVLDDAEALRELPDTASTFDAAWIELEAMAGADLQSIGRETARVLRPGAAVVCVAPRGLFSAVRRAFRPIVRWRRGWALGAFVPGGTEWPRLHPITLGLRAAAEHVLGGWPLVRALGEWSVHEGVRR